MSSKFLHRSCKDISKRLAELKTYQSNAIMDVDADLSQRASSIAIDRDDSSQSISKDKPLSAKEKAKQRMLKRLQELEQT